MNRVELQSLLEETLGSDHVYYQPPASLRMVYPAIVYSRYDVEKDYANNGTYLKYPSYQITVIAKDPDCDAVDKVADLPMCRYDRHYVADNLNHDVFTIYS